MNIVSGSNAGGKVSISQSNGTPVITVTQDNKLGFYNATAIAKPSSVGDTTLTAAGSGNALKDDSTTTGGTGSTAYTLADVVKHLKALGLLTE